MVGFGGVEVGADAEPAGELGGRHEGAVENVELLDLVVVEEDREGGTVQQRDDTRVRGDEGPRRHVGSDHGGVVFFNPRREELVASLVVEVVVSVAYCSKKRHSVAACGGVRDGSKNF